MQAILLSLLSLSGATIAWVYLIDAKAAAK
jgi:hypothetical protein